MAKSAQNTVTWICDVCGKQETDTYDPIDIWGMDYQDHSLIPGYWSSCAIRDVDGRLHQGHFCSVEHLQDWILKQIPDLETIRSEGQRRWDGTRVWKRLEDGRLVEKEREAYPYATITGI